MVANVICAFCQSGSMTSPTHTHCGVCETCECMHIEAHSMHGCAGYTSDSSTCTLLRTSSSRSHQSSALPYFVQHVRVYMHVCSVLYVRVCVNMSWLWCVCSIEPGVEVEVTIADV